MICRSKRHANEEKQIKGVSLPFKMKALFLASLSVIVLTGLLSWTTDCFGYDQVFWTQSFEEFPGPGLSLDDYPSYTENPDDVIYPGYPDDPSAWFSDNTNTTDGNYSLKWTELNPGASYFWWFEGKDIFEENVKRGSLYFDFLISQESFSPYTQISISDENGGFNYGDSAIQISHQDLFLNDRGTWNSIELNWSWDEFDVGSFTTELYINGHFEGVYFGRESSGKVVGFFLLSMAHPEYSDGYILIDNFKMSIDERPDLTTDYIFDDWEDYYNSFSEKFENSTPLFISMADSFKPIITKAGEFSLFAENYFNQVEAEQKGANLGMAIPTARGYLIVLDDFIGLPLSGLLLFYFLTIAVVISYKVILSIIKIFKP